MTKFVFAFEYYPNCPIHDGGSFSGLKKTNNLDEVLDFALKNLNIFGVLDIVSVDDDNEYYIDYITESHRYCGFILYVNDSKVAYTADNGSGELVLNYV